MCLGDQIHVTLEMDTKPRVIPMPKKFAVALQKNKDAKTAFEKLSPSHQRELVTYLNYLKRPETLRKNIEKAITKLVDKR